MLRGKSEKSHNCVTREDYENTTSIFDKLISVYSLDQNHNSCQIFVNCVILQSPKFRG